MSTNNKHDGMRLRAASSNALEEEVLQSNPLEAFGTQDES
jgi:hypothetical protein